MKRAVPVPLPFVPPPVSGDMLIQRRIAGRCLRCGLPVPPPVSPGSEQAWLCKRCDAAQPKKPRFNRQKEVQAGLDNLDRLLKD